MVKMLDVSKNVISRYSAEKVYKEAYEWAKEYDEELKEMLDNKDYSLKVLGIERGNVKPRKDISKWSDVKYIISYMYDELGYAREVKEYKLEPEKYKGHVGDLSTVIRVKVTGRCNTPDLYEIMKVLGKERILKRI